jgi:hypothetical protein
MQIAERNIEERLHALTTESRQLRQTSITSERRYYGGVRSAAGQRAVLAEIHPKLYT